LRRHAALLLLFAAALLPACDRVSHENLDKWMNTENGPGKLLKALRSSDQDADMRAHAAQNLIVIDDFGEVKDTFDNMDDSTRHAVMVKLAPRLWDKARIAGAMDVPTTVQTNAKDALFDLRGYADDTTRKAIDGYLIEWLTGGYYEGRAKTGRVSGASIVKALGEAAAPKLTEAARRIMIKPPDAGGGHAKLGDELLDALAWTGDKDAAGLLLELVEKDYKDDTLPQRALGALHDAYVQPAAGQPLSPRPALTGYIDRLGKIATNDNLPGVMNNDAVDLIAVVGPPDCIAPFVEMAGLPVAERAFRYVGMQRGLRCGGAQAVVPVVEAIPTTVAYERALLDKYVWKEILAAPAPVKVAEQCRKLLDSNSWVARVTGIEVLGQLALAPSAAEDAKRIRQLASDKTLLKGWWGPQKDVPARKKKRDPTIGQLAAAVAGQLQGLAKGPKTK
jgi:hypothetical protein